MPTSIQINHLVGSSLVYEHIDAFQNSVWLHFLKEIKVPENDRQIPLTFAYTRAMKYILSVIHGSNYEITRNYESIHVRKRIFDYFSYFGFTTLTIGMG